MALATTGLSCGQADLECHRSYMGRLDTTRVLLWLERKAEDHLASFLWPLGYANTTYSAVMDDFRGRLRHTRRLWCLLG